MPGNKFIEAALEMIMGDELSDLDKLAEKQLAAAKEQAAEKAKSQQKGFMEELVAQQKAMDQMLINSAFPKELYGPGKLDDFIGQSPNPAPQMSAAQKAKLQALQQKTAQVLEKQYQKKADPPEPAKAVRVFVHGMTGKTTPVVIKAGDRLEIHTKDGYLCAIISLDPNVPEQAQKEAETQAPDNTTRIVEI